MKLAVLGVATVVLGVLLNVPGLIAAGGWWIVTGPVIRSHAKRVNARRAENKAKLEAGLGDAQEPVVDGRQLARGIGLMLLVAVPSLVIGILALGIDDENLGWRWLPIGVGAVAAAFALVSVFLLVTGFKVSASGEALGAADKPATVIIRSVSETGTYINQRPRLEFELTVQPDGMAPYEVTKRATVPFTALGSLRVGDGFRAMVAGPDDPTTMEIDWAAPVSTGNDTGRGAGRSVEGNDAQERLATLDELREGGRITEEEYDTQRRRILDSL